MEKPIRTWKEAFKLTNPESLRGITLEIWFHGEEDLSESADPPDQEVRLVFRCEVDNVVADEHEPLLTRNWKKFTHDRGFWVEHEPLGHLLYMGGASLTGFRIHEGLIRTMAPVLNVHVIFFYPGKNPPPEKPAQPFTVEEIAEIVEGKNPRA